jgi:hypothetical protein
MKLRKPLNREKTLNLVEQLPHSLMDKTVLIVNLAKFSIYKLLNAVTVQNSNFSTNKPTPAIKDNTQAICKEEIGYQPILKKFKY